MTPSTLIVDLNREYDKRHQAKETLFWATKMGTSDDFEGFHEAEQAHQDFCQNPENLKRCREALPNAEGEDRDTLRGWIQFFEANVMESEAAKATSSEIARLEGELAKARKGMDLGYTAPDGEWIPTSSVGLALKMVSDDDEAVRKACYEGLASIETFVAENGFFDIVKKRNQMARELGYDNFYAYKLKVTEGISMSRLFEWLETLEQETRDAAQRTLKELSEEKGQAACKPWNYSYETQGSLIKELDPYMPFSESLLRWGQTFAGMGIRFSNCQLELDLLDRKGKYENGFCHAPIVAYKKRNGEAIPAQINFSSNAIPSQVGSGYSALNTFFHEGGHAAHFANVLMGAPCFSQEFAPSSIAMAETQSMFCDSVLSDSDWLNRYAGVPWQLIEKKVRLGQPLKVLALRRMLVVPFFEKALYELEDDNLSWDKVKPIAQEIEQKLTFMERSPRPVLAIPHLLESESSAYYHGYILADCAVEQTREFFLKRDGHLIDNPKVGEDLDKVYWKPGNSVPFVDFIERLVGSPFSVEPKIREVSRDVDQALDEEKNKMEFIQTVPKFEAKVNLGFNLKIVHGDEEVASTSSLSFEEAAEKFKDWVVSQ